MRLFDPRTRSLSERHKRIYAICEIAYTAVDFSAALLFIVGSFLFFDESTTRFGTWLFVVGSFLFGMRPTIKLTRELIYLREGKLDEIGAPQA